jgi:PadR family transcriptional regulator
MQNSGEVRMCDMRGMLSFTILWIVSKRAMYGQEIATEIGKRRGEKPNPGTIYPALKDLANHGLIEARIEGRNSVYRLTRNGALSLAKSKKYFERAFGDILGVGTPEVITKRRAALAPRMITR